MVQNLEQELNLRTSNWQKSCAGHVLEYLQKQKVYSSFRGNICGVDLEDMQSISK